MVDVKAPGTAHKVEGLGSEALGFVGPIQGSEVWGNTQRPDNQQTE